MTSHTSPFAGHGQFAQVTSLMIQHYQDPSQKLTMRQGVWEHIACNETGLWGILHLGQLLLAEPVHQK